MNIATKPEVSTRNNESAKTKQRKQIGLTFTSVHSQLTKKLQCSGLEESRSGCPDRSLQWHFFTLCISFRYFFACYWHEAAEPKAIVNDFRGDRPKHWFVDPSALLISPIRWRHCQVTAAAACLSLTIYSN